MNLCADLGLWGAPACEPRLKVWDYGSLRKASPSRLRRRSRRASERERIAAAKRAAAENAAAENLAAENATAEKEKADAEKCDTMKAAEKCAAVKNAEKCAAMKAAEEVAAKAAAKEATAKVAAEEAAAKAAAEEVNAKVAAEEAAAKAAAESAATTASAPAVKVGAKVAESPSREILESDQATTSGKKSQCECEELASSTSLDEAEQKFYEFRSRWIQRLDKSTDNWDLKTKILESLEDAYLAPVSVLSNGDFNNVKDKFIEGILSPVRFLEDLQKMLGSARTDVNL